MRQMKIGLEMMITILTDLPGDIFLIYCNSSTNEGFCPDESESSMDFTSSQVPGASEILEYCQGFSESPK